MADTTSAANMARIRHLARAMQQRRAAVHLVTRPSTANYERDAVAGNPRGAFASNPAAIVERVHSEVARG